ncbi:hypothetical protein [Chitinophaga nivalis]|uniref:CHAT domain-containing protein n=1 Tax=Chitinophaga nivalis TaxID=2991709 RepID=A0ABT3IKA0_9BACT|nr:hypothetical protein [Chitinophaga nivalis]MCW3465940.1 hypothetical protein [Chitinophaga nivalis]MCW3484369.1 hypothetical protein [Chitinophaga nivalis]
MSKLFVFIPFKKSKLDMGKDLPPQAIDFQNTFNKVSSKLIRENINATIDSLEVVYSGTKFTVTKDDYIIVFAHGSKKTSDKLFSNEPDLEVTTDAVIKELVTCKANTAKRILFMCCYSAVTTDSKKHVAVLWKEKYPNQVVYGGDDAISYLFAATSTQIRACCIALFTI